MNNNDSVKQYKLNDYCIGFAELKDNCWNYSIIANDPRVDIFNNEYNAGYIQGKLQGKKAIKAARNNTWNNTYLCDTSEPDKKFPKNIDPSKDELEIVAKRLDSNFRYLLGWIEGNETNEVALHIKRLAIRMLGIYDGAVGIEFLQHICSDTLKPDCLEFELAYGDEPLTFGDIYLINAQSDLFDALASSSKESCRGLHKSDHCSAFVKRTADGDIYWTHNTWAGFLCQSHTISYAICGDFVTQNAYCPGQFGSNMDFGFNGHGICFNETTHRYSHTEVKEGIWICWRAAAAEMFAKDINDFYRHLTIDNTGTYLNGYMLIDANTKETALIEMSYQRFVLFYSKDGKNLKVTDSVLGGDKDGKSYDQHLITPDYILGVNYPISKNVAYDLESTDNRPMRRIQFFNQIGGVKDMDTAKNLITYVDNDNPLSIYGRWDLGRGVTEYPKTIPDGAVDAKVYSANEVERLLKELKYIPNERGGKTAFWMLYGTPKIDGKPFIWSESQWAEYKKGQDKDMVPDRLEGAWNKTKLFMD